MIPPRFSSRLGLVRAGFQWVGVILLGLLSVAAPAQEAPDRRDLDFANRLLRDRRYDLAVEEYTRVLKARPNDGDARFGLATARWSLQDYAEARRQFEQLLRLAPTHVGAPTAWFRVGETAYLLGDLPGARTALETYTSRYPEHRYLDIAWTYLGEIRFRQGDLDGARTAYENVVTQKPPSRLIDRARYGLARTLAARHDYTAARNLFQEILQGGNRDWTDKAAFQIGMMELAAGKADEAIAAFEAFEAKAPQSPLREESRLRRAEALGKLGRLDDAVALVGPIARGEGGLAPQAAYTLAGLLLKQNHPAEALATCDEALKRFPESTLSPWLLFQSAEAAAAAGQPDKARKRFQRLASLYPRDEWADDALLRAADLAQKAGDPAAARELATALAKQFPNSPHRTQARLIEAQAALAAKDPRSAVALLEPLLTDDRLDPALASSIRLALGMAYRDAGQNEKAQEILGAMTTAAPAAGTPAGPAGVEAQYLLGLGHFDAQRYAEAIPALEAYLAARPKGEVAPDALALLAIAHAALDQPERARTALDRLASQFPPGKPLLQARLRLGETALDARDYDRAAALFQAALEQAGDTQRDAQGRALWGLAWCQFENHQNTEAAATFSRFLSLMPEDPRAADAALAHAQALDAADQTDAALAAYHEVASRYEKQDRIAAAALLARARLLDRSGKKVESAEAYEAYLKAYPQPPDPTSASTETILAELGWTWLDAGRQSEATAAFRRLLDQYPSSPRAADARVALAEAAHADHKPEEAEALLGPVLSPNAQADPILVQSALFRQGLIQRDREDWPAALTTFRRLIAEFPESPNASKARFWLADTALRSGDAKTAEAEFAAVVKMAGAEEWRPTARLRHIECLVALERWADALTEIEALRSDTPTFPALHELDYAQGRALQGLGRFDEARTAFQSVIDARRDDDFAARAQLMRGETYFHQQKYSEALKEFLRLIYQEDAPAALKAAALLEAAKVAEKLERWSDAVDFYKQVLAKHANDPQARTAAERLKAVEARTVTPAPSSSR